MKAVFDCMVYVQAVMSERGPAAACLDLCEKDYVEVCVCPMIISELRDVLNRPELRSKIRRMTDERVAEFMDRLVELSHSCVDPQLLVQVPRDLKDEPYLNLAIEQRADYLVSRDGDLLSLQNDASVRQAHPGLSIVSPEEFLRQVRIHIAKDLGYE